MVDELVYVICELLNRLRATGSLGHLETPRKADSPGSGELDALHVATVKCKATNQPPLSVDPGVNDQSV